MSEKYAPNDLPAKIEITLHTHYCYNSEYSWMRGLITHAPEDFTGESYICIAKTPVTIYPEAPGDDFKKKVLDALNTEKQRLMADHHKRMFELQEKIDSLLCLEYTPPATDSLGPDEVPF